MNEDKNLKIKYVMVEPDSSADVDEIDLIELMRTLFRAWKIIVACTFLCVGLAYLYAMGVPEAYRTQILLAPVQEEQNGVSSALGQFGGFATMVGAQIPRDSNIKRVIATLESRKFLGNYIRNQNLMPILFQQHWDEGNKAWLIDPPPSEKSAVNTLKSRMSIEEDTISGLITLSVVWTNPQFATKVANEVIEQLNKQLREQAVADSQKRIGYLERELAKTTLQDMRAVLYNLLESEKQKAMLANVNDDFALQVIDPALEPTTPYKPNRKLISVMGAVCGGILGIIGAFVLNLFQKLKSSKSPNPSSNV